jgi:hypothetical protein
VNSVLDSGFSAPTATLFEIIGLSQKLRPHRELSDLLLSPRVSETLEKFAFLANLVQKKRCAQSF